MPDAPSRIEIPLHVNAQARIQRFVDDFATSLVLQAKLLAFRERADEVLSPHVEEALDIVKYKGRGWWRDLITIVGGALFGAFIPGFFDALPKHDTRATVIYTAMGFIGMLLVFLGIRS
jgi:hypothetical protein